MTTEAWTVLRRAAGKKKHFDERQARWDCAALVADYPRTAKWYHKSASPARVMAEWAADVYHFHTGRFPGRAEPEGGYYPVFIRALLLAAGVSCSDATVHSASREAGRKLNRRAGLDKMGRTIRGQDHPLNSARAYRNNARARMLETHVAGEDELGFDVLGGYEPAGDPERSSVDTFGLALRKLGVVD